MPKQKYSVFLYEAIKITIFCIAITIGYWLLGVNQSTLLIMFNIAVMSCAATFTPVKKSLWIIVQGSLVVLLSITIGGVFGYYLPILSKLVCMVYAVFAFLIPKTKLQRTIFTSGAVTFLIFISLPFDFENGIRNFLYALLIIPSIVIFYWLFDRRIYSNEKLIIDSSDSINNRIRSSIVAGLVLLCAFSSELLLRRYTNLSHLYWIGLTTLVVIQGTQIQTIKISLTRIGVNIIGALLVVVLMNYVLPSTFWVNLAVLTTFLFFIFALGFSYVYRTLFIELFVLSFTHLLGNYHDDIAYQRILLTLLGGAMVIIITLLVDLYVYLVGKSRFTRLKLTGFIK